jgi:hypothetical protein
MKYAFIAILVSSCLSAQADTLDLIKSRNTEVTCKLVFENTYYDYLIASNKLDNSASAKLIFGERTHGDIGQLVGEAGAAEIKPSNGGFLVVSSIPEEDRRELRKVSIDMKQAAIPTISLKAKYVKWMRFGEAGNCNYCVWSDYGAYLFYDEIGNLTDLVSQQGIEVRDNTQCTYKQLAGW